MSAKQCLTDSSNKEDINPLSTTQFTKLEENLRSFVLTKRTLSKLYPIKTYLQNLLQDITSITSFNSKKTRTNLTNLERIQRENSPIYDALQHIKNDVLLNSDSVVDKKVSELSQKILPLLNNFVSNIDFYIERIEFPGFFSIGYIARMKCVILKLSEHKLNSCRQLAECELSENVHILETTAFRYFDSGKVLLDDQGIKSSFDSDIEINFPRELWSWNSILRDLLAGSLILCSGVLGFFYGDFRFQYVASQDLFFGICAIGE